MALQVVNDISNCWPGSAIPFWRAEARWYAAYTLTNHEKSVAEQLSRKTIETFLPVYESVRRWKDRRVRLQAPLFPGYVFVRIPIMARVEVLQLRSVVRLVGFNGQPTALPDDEIAAFRMGVEQKLRWEPHPYLRIGRRARIRSGPLRGMEGVLVNLKGHCRVVLTIDAITRSIAVEVDVADLEFPPS